MILVLVEPYVFASVIADALRTRGAYDVVAPDLRGRGIGRFLLEYAEQAAPRSVTTYSLLTGTGNRRSQKIYTRAGYRSRGEVSPGVVRFSKPRS